MNTEWLKEAIERVAKQKRVESASLLLRVENENLSRFAENRITQNTTRHRIHLFEAIANALPEDPEFVPLPRSQRYLKVDRFFQGTAELAVETKARVIREITAEAASRKMTAAGIYRSGDYALLIANTEGLFGEHRWTKAEFSITARTGDSAASAVAEDESVTNINPQALAIEAFRTAQMARNPKPLKPGRYKTLLTARAMGEMMPFVLYQMDRRAADEGRSFFAGKLGKKIVSNRVSIVADPANPANPSSPMDLYNDGVARRKTAFIKDGVLENLWTMRYWAKKQRIPHVPPSFSFSMSGGTRTLDQIIKRIDRGLLAMHLWYIRYVNPMELILTGTSRDGLFLVEDGKIKHAVRHMRLNDSPMRILKNPRVLGIPERRGGSMMLPPVLVDDFNWASATTF